MVLPRLIAKVGLRLRDCCLRQRQRQRQRPLSCAVLSVPPYRMICSSQANLSPILVQRPASLYVRACDPHSIWPSLSRTRTKNISDQQL